eukprot:CAMPEP_0180400494 /NCGR_PEP_ID=MMETSP0989-20121125/37770_1 /TAXON_ID=697907 /ORGANISM="non described non described, Strain CCMP2293" /LENGTH=62 /DNA_ID=CAMNT_0022403363 /DNA_START=119 /DNA_END=303 /DNA_ORIENTATION=-
MELSPPAHRELRKQLCSSAEDGEGMGDTRITPELRDPNIQHHPTKHRSSPWSTTANAQLSGV